MKISKQDTEVVFLNSFVIECICAQYFEEDEKKSTLMIAGIALITSGVVLATLAVAVFLQSTPKATIYENTMTNTTAISSSSSSSTATINKERNSNTQLVSTTPKKTIDVTRFLICNTSKNDFCSYCEST